MLLALEVRNFGLIDHLELAFGAGLNVITGETGAGKSMLIDAMQLICGGRASADQVRTGEDTATVDAVFDLSNLPGCQALLDELGLSSGAQVVISREINTAGRNLCRVNGRLTTAAVARDIAAVLIDIHGQHEHHSLLEPAQHRVLLDAYGGAQHRTLAVAAQTAHQALRQAEAQLAAVSGNARDRAQREDLLRFQLAEIDAARLQPHEDEELREERHLLVNAEKLASAADAAVALIFEGGVPSARGPGTGGARRVAGQAAPASEPARDLLATALGQLDAAASLDRRVAPATETLRTIVYSLDDLARDLRSYRDGIEFDPGRLEAVQSRLDSLAALRRKYADTVDGIIEHATGLRRKLDDLARSEEVAAKLEETIESCRADLAVAAATLSSARRALADKLQSEVAAELSELGMPAAAFSVAIQRRIDPGGIMVDGQSCAYGAHGIDEVEFMLAPNPGEPARRLARAASGGELSRVMLAIKTVLARADRIPAVIFDEIDSGIGGQTANAVGLRLARLGLTHQVLCVTHLPQIAAFADRHYVVSKRSTADRTWTHVQAVTGEQRVAEVARMLGGTVAAIATRNHAVELLRRDWRTNEPLPTGGNW
jgi:DNA repair protein RecN (Recombination protein N)